MKFRLIHIVTFLAVYLPLESFVLKWLPVPDSAYLLLRQIPDLLTFAVCIAMIGRQVFEFRPLRMVSGRFDLLLALFVVLACVSAGLNRIGPAAAFIELKALLRFVLLGCTLALMRPSERDLNRFLKCLLYGVGLQMCFAGLQMMGGIPARDFLIGRDAGESMLGQTAVFTGDKSGEGNALIGTLGSMINFALFLIVGLCAWLPVNARKRGIYWAGCGVFVALIYLTHARAPLIVAVSLVLLHQFWLHGGRRVLLQVTLLVGLVAVGLAAGLQNSQDITSYDSPFRVFSLFSPGIFEDFLNQRLGIILYLVPEFLHRWTALFGVGPDPLAVVDWFGRQPGIPAVLMLVLPGIAGDVYWCTLLFYYGLIGLLAFLGILALCYRMMRNVARETDGIHGTMAQMAVLLLLASVPLNFVNQAFAIRQFSFYLWVAVGLVLGCSARKKLRVDR
jgi:hypothetical protein